MQIAQAGDRVQVHYEKRLQDGSFVSSRDREAIELTVGEAHPRLPGLGLTLVGLSPGTRATVTVPPEQAYGVPDPRRIKRLPRRRFVRHPQLTIGQQVPVKNRLGRRRLVRVLEVGETDVVVDTNHRWAGQTLQLDVELIAIENRQSDQPGEDA